MKKILILSCIVLCSFSGFTQLKSPVPTDIISINLKTNSNSVTSGSVIEITGNTNLQGWDQILDDKITTFDNVIFNGKVEFSPIPQFFNFYPFTRFYARLYNYMNEPVQTSFFVKMRSIYDGQPVQERLFVTVNPGSYYNISKCYVYTRNNCLSGYQGQTTNPVCTYANQYFSTVSQEDADQKAKDALDLNVQTALNIYGQCYRVYSNVSLTQAFLRNNCPTGKVGSTVNYTVPANKYTSIISQADANAKAQAEATANGQAQANNLGVCL